MSADSTDDFLYRQMIKQLSGKEEGNAGALAALGTIYLSGRGVGTDYAKAKECFELSAQKGCSLGMCAIGTMYLYGMGVKRDLNKAWECFNEAAGLNDADALYYLSFFYSVFCESKQAPVAKDLNKAAELLEKATLKGSRFAPYTLAMHHLKKWDAVREENSSRVRALLMEASKRSDSRADLMLGILCFNGWACFQQSRTKAVKYWEKASSPQSLFLLGQLYRLGDGVRTSAKTACKYYQRAAKMGYEPAQYALACLLYSKSNPEYEKALHWFEQSSQNGNPKAMLAAAAMYEEGDGCQKDLGKAARYITMAQVRGDPDAEYAMGSMYRFGMMRAADSGLARDYYIRAADKGQDRAAYAIGQMYYYDKYAGEGNLSKAANWYRRTVKGSLMGEAAFSLGYIEQRLHHDESAFEYYKKAAGKGYGPAQYNLGLMYLTGKGARVSYSQAQVYLLRANQQEIPEAYFALGYMHYHGLGTPCSPAYSLSFFEKAQRCHHAEAAYYLGRMYYYGEGVDQNFKSACRYYRCAAVLGHAQAGFEVGLMYMLGEGCMQNLDEAERFLTMSLEGGFKTAAVHLKLLAQVKAEQSERFKDEALLREED